MSVTRIVPPGPRHPRASRPTKVRPRPRFSRILRRQRPRQESTGR